MKYKYEKQLFIKCPLNGYTIFAINSNCIHTTSLEINQQINAIATECLFVRFTAKMLLQILNGHRCVKYTQVNVQIFGEFCKNSKELQICQMMKEFHLVNTKLCLIKCFSFHDAKFYTYFKLCRKALNNCSEPLLLSPFRKKSQKFFTNY